jgi:hypothetical protein
MLCGLGWYACGFFFILPYLMIWLMRENTGEMKGRHGFWSSFSFLEPNSISNLIWILELGSIKASRINLILILGIKQYLLCTCQIQNSIYSGINCFLGKRSLIITFLSFLLWFLRGASIYGLCHLTALHVCFAVFQVFLAQGSPLL